MSTLFERVRSLFAAVLLGLTPAVLLSGVGLAQAVQTTTATTQILDRAAASRLLPPAVFYAGQVAPVQARNSGGLRFSSGKVFLAMLVDSSGYSSAVQQKFQGYLVSEVPVRIGTAQLPAGAYGFGFVNHQVIVMNLGGSTVLEQPTSADTEMRRPTPLQLLADTSSPGAARLYLGREYVVVSSVAESNTPR